MTDDASAQAAISEEMPAVVRTAGTGAMLVGLVVLLGWGFDIDRLTTVLPGYGTMEISTAVAFILIGIALNELARRNSRGSRLIARAVSVTILFIAGTSLAELLFGLELGVGTRNSALSPHAPMSLLCGACLALLAWSLLLLPSRRRWTGRLLQVLALTTLFVSGLCLVGYAYDISSLFQFDQYTSMAIHTAATMVLVCVGLLFARQDLEIMAPIRSQRLGGLAARTLLPAAVSVPLILGWVKLQGEVLGFYQLEFGTAIQTVATIIAFAILVWYCARTLNQADEQRDLAQRAQQQLRILTEFDPLTGTLNRRSLAERSEREWSRALRYNRPLSCVMIDLDGFKNVNDTHGHLAGDAVLREVAALLLRQCRPSDLVARFGGEEFCIITPEIDLEAAAQLAERLRDAVARLRVETPAGPLSVTGSFGVAESCQGIDSVERLISRADDALLTAKRTGRNCVVVAKTPQKGMLPTGSATTPAVVEVAEPACSPCE